MGVNILCGETVQVQASINNSRLYRILTVILQVKGMFMQDMHIPKYFRQTFIAASSVLGIGVLNTAATLLIL